MKNIRKFFKLFGAFYYDGKRETENNIEYKTKKLLDYAIVPTIEWIALSQKYYDEFLNIVIEEYGKKRDYNNTRFYPDFEFVKESSNEVLRFLQLLHYMTTYGAEELGIKEWVPTFWIKYKKSVEKVIQHGMKEIKIYTKDEATKKIENLLYGNNPLKENELHDLIDLASQFFTIDITKIKSREIFMTIFSKASDQPEFLQNINPAIPAHMILRISALFLTGIITFVKNNETKDLMKLYKFTHHQKEFILKALNMVDEIEFQKSYKESKKIWHIIERKIRPERLTRRWQRVRELFDKAHTSNIATNGKIIEVGLGLDSLPSNYILQNTTKLLRIHPADYVMPDIISAINKNTDWKYLIKLLNVIRMETNKEIRNKIDQIPVRIRNGKNNLRKLSEPIDSSIATEIENAIIMRLQKLSNEYAKKIYIDKKIYGFKPLLSNKRTVAPWFPPMGSYVKIDCDKNDLAVGIHWLNNKTSGGYSYEIRIDLDLSAIFVHENGEMEYISWSGGFRKIEDDISVMHSGDVTSAPRERGGAAEVIFIEKKEKIHNNVLISLDVRNYTSSRICEDASIIIAPINKNEKEHMMYNKANINKKAIFSSKVKFNIDNIPNNLYAGIYDIKNNMFIFGSYDSMNRIADLDDTALAKIWHLTIKSRIDFSLGELTEILKDNIVDNKEDADIIWTHENYNSIEILQEMDKIFNK